MATGGTTVPPSSAVGQTAALSFVPVPTAADTAAAKAGTPGTPVPYTSSTPATPPQFGPVLAQTDRYGMPQSTPSATLPNSAGVETPMYQPASFSNPLNTPPGTAAPPPSTPKPPSDPGQVVTSGAPLPGASGLFGVQGGQYFPLNFGTTQASGTPPNFSSGYGQLSIPSGDSVYTGGVSPGLYNGPVYSYAGNNTAPTLLNPQTAKRGGAIKKMAAGGIPNASEMDPWYTRQEERSMVHPEGLIKSMGAGRTDIHPIQVPAGSYVIPADVVSGLAEGNTMAGSNIIDRMMHSLPFGIQGGGSKHGSGPPRAQDAKPYVEPPDPYNTAPKDARGGATKDHGSGLVPIIVAGGEHIVYPQTIQKKFGNLKKGHAVLDKWVLKSRNENVNTIRNLKGPKK